MKTILKLLLVVLAMLGFLDAGYITYEKMSGVIPPCSVYFKCGNVLNSSWSRVGPVPLSVFGMIHYLVFFCLAVALFLDVKRITVAGKQLKIDDLIFLQSSWGILFSAYLVFIMAFMIKAWCLYCLLSASICTLLFILTSSYRFLVKKD